MRLVITFFFLLMQTSAMCAETATIHSSDLRIEISGPSKARIVRKYSITIRDKESYHLAVYRDYYDKFRKIRNLSVEILDSQGQRVKKLHKSDALDFAFNASYEVLDARQLYLDPDYQEFPFNVNVEVEIELKGFINLPTWVPRYSAGVKVEQSTLQVVTPMDYELRTFNEHDLVPQITEDLEENTRSFFWSVADLSAYEEKTDYKTFYDRQPKVHLAPAKFEYGGYSGSMDTWSHFGDWFLALNEGRDLIGPKTANFLNSVNNESLADDVIEIFEYMQSRTRYVSIQLGIGGFQSLPADFVDEKGYGECKALTNYMRAMLSYKGIGSNYVLVKAGADVPDVEAQFSSNQFNHVFLGVPLESDTLYLECTSQIIPPDYIGTFTDDRYALWVAEGGSELIRTPIYTAENNVLKKKATVQLAQNGDATIHLSTDHAGVFYDNLLSYKYANSGTIDRFLYGQFTYDDFTIKDYETSETEGSANYVSQYTLEVNNLAKTTSDMLLLPCNVLQRLDAYVQTNRYTRFSEVRRGFTLSEEVQVELPQGFSLRGLPNEAKLNSKYGSYAISFEYTDRGVLIKRELVVLKGRYELEAFDDFHAFVKQIRRADNSKLVIRSKT